MPKWKMNNGDGRRNQLEGTPSRDEFAGRMMDAIRRAGETEPIRYDPDEFILASQGHEFRLARVFRVYCCSMDRASVFRNCVAGWFSHRKLPEKYEDTTPDLLPQIIRRTQYESRMPDLNGDGDEDRGFTTWSIADYLAVVAAYDLPEGIITLELWNLTALWGVDYEKALRDAYVNLLDISKEPFESLQPGVYVSPWRDSHDASRLLLIDRIKQLNVKGDHVAMVPNRDTLLVTGSGDSAGLARMAEIANVAIGHPYPISALPVRLADDVWENFMPDADHPSFRNFKSLRTRSIALDYCDQQEQLNSLFEKIGVYAATYNVVQSRITGEYLSYCVWTGETLSALPRTDVVGFVLPDKPMGQCSVASDWDSVFGTAGVATIPMNTCPERYLVAGVPPPDYLSAMGIRNLTECFTELSNRGDQGTQHCL